MRQTKDTNGFLDSSFNRPVSDVSETIENEMTTVVERNRFKSIEYTIR